LTLTVLLFTCGMSSARAGVITFNGEEFRPSAEAVVEVMLSIPSTEVQQEVGEDDESSMECTRVISPDLSQFAFCSDCQFSLDLSVDIALIDGDQCPSQPHVRGLLRPA
jgi:hypothetical protein